MLSKLRLQDLDKNKDGEVNFSEFLDWYIDWSARYGFRFDSPDPEEEQVNGVK
jgi:hypothetical protein